MSPKRTPLPPRTARIARSPIKRKPRKPSETLRIYGTPERRAWVKALPCVVCVALHPLLALGCGPSDNAHTETGGTGRKADAATIAPLCPSHHRQFDQYQPPFDQEAMREAMKAAARATDAAWVRYQERVA